MKLLLNIFLGATALVYLCSGAKLIASDDNVTMYTGAIYFIFGLVSGGLLWASLLGMISC